MSDCVRVNIARGDVTCTLRNTRDTFLTVTKIVINNDGGTGAVAEFTLFIDGVPTGSGSATPVTAGVHTVSENPNPGYVGTIGGDCAPDGTITLALGDNRFCTITNDDVPSTLTVTKIVINDNGGTAGEAEFTLFIDGVPTGSGSATPVAVGVHTISEDPNPDYVGTVGGDCALDGTITIAAGDNRFCTITNDDIPPRLIVTKRVTNDDGGTAIPSDFTLRVDRREVTSGVPTEVMADVLYTVGEDDPGPLGYTQVSISEDCAPDGTITLALAEAAECFIDNDDDGNGNGNGDRPGTGGGDPGDVGDPGTGGEDPGGLPDPAGGLDQPSGLPATGSGGLEQPIATDGFSATLAVILGIVAAAAAGGLVLIRRRT